MQLTYYSLSLLYLWNGMVTPSTDSTASAQYATPHTTA